MSQEQDTGYGTGSRLWDTGPPPLPPASEMKERVRVEEITIVTLILILWVCAIILFVHRWGKIRMLVPHQPRYAYAQAQANADKLKVRSFGLSSNDNCIQYILYKPLQKSLNNEVLF